MSDDGSGISSDDGESYDDDSHEDGYHEEENNDIDDIDDIRELYRELIQPDAYGHDSDSYIEYDNGSDSEDSDSEDSEDSGGNSDINIEQFLMNFHKGKFDNDIDNALRSDAGNNDGRDEQYEPDDWEERKSLSLQNLKANLRHKTQKIVLGEWTLGAHFYLSSDSRQPGQGATPRTSEGQQKEPVVMHNQCLDSYWNELSDALAQSQNNFSCQYLSITNIQLTKNVMAMLASNFRGIERIDFDNTFLCQEGIKLLATLLDHNPNLSLHLHGNAIRDLNDMTCLSRVVRYHSPHLVLRIDGISIGNNAIALSEILQSGVEEIYLDQCQIASSGAEIIKQFLQTNPTLKRLSLSNNCFNNGDAILFAEALKMNSNLQYLGLRRQNFTSAGIKAILTAIYDSSSLNAISGCNHTCKVHFLNDPSLNVLNNVNEYVERRYNRNGKLLLALHSKESLLEYLDEMPAELMPDVLAFMHTEERPRKRMDMVYTTLRSWNMPSLYSFQSVPKSTKKKRSCSPE